MLSCAFRLLSAFCHAIVCLDRKEKKAPLFLYVWTMESGLESVGRAFCFPFFWVWKAESAKKYEDLHEVGELIKTILTKGVCENG